MTKTRSTKRALLLSALSLLMCVSMLIGSTFAWFSDSVISGQNKIQAGNLKVDLEIYDKVEGFQSVKNDQDPIFTYTNWEPGYVDAKLLKVENEGSLALKWKAVFVSNTELGILADVIDVFVKPGVTEAEYNALTRDDLATWTNAGTDRELVKGIETYTYGTLNPKGTTGDSATLGIALKMREEAGNEYKNESIAPFDIKILATQYTYEKDSFEDQFDKDAPKLTDIWDGTADTSWYNDTDTEFILTSAEQLAGLAELVDGGNTFENKTIKLDANMDLRYIPEGATEPMCFEPIGSYRKNLEFKGTFDGQGHTISNMSQNTWALDNGYYYDDLGLGLFGKVRDAKIKNLVMDGASISGESGIVGIVAAAAYGDCIFENIEVSNSQGADYQYYAGGVVGWASGDHIYKNITIDESTVIGSQWGDFGNASGGIIGGCGSSTKILMEDCTVACRIDAVNDVVSAYQWYCYRNCGMLIGQTNNTATNEAVTDAAAPNLTCKNVTVIYGDWANYTYCEFAGTGYPYVRVQAGTSVDAYTNVRYGHPTDANGNTVVDDNHVHNDGEDHHMLIAFDQLYGGPAEHHYCTYGVATHPGVTVIYNNK